MMTERQKQFQNLVFYQIYPRSFCDSNSDGIGDLAGIIAKLDYLKELGVNAIWLSPCFKSPNEDGGYDISDYRDIMDELGTLNEWKEMVHQMHKRGMLLIMDFVANHTSTEHEWFKRSRSSKDNPYREYYYWADEPLFDWKSDFGGSAWEYDDLTGQYYLHSFTKGQPDLNWENPKVQEEMKNIVDFWVDMGVDGFRCDAFDMIAKDFEKGINGATPKLHEYIKILFNREKTKNIFTVGECWGADKNYIKLLTDGARNELMTAFYFDHVFVGQKDWFEPEPFVLDDLRDIFVEWQEYMQENDLLNTLFLENHDLVRCVSKFADDRQYRYESATMLAVMCFLQKGIPFIYQGQEIGMINSDCNNIDELRDAKSINYYNKNKYKFKTKELWKRINCSSRDQGRYMIPWNETEYEKAISKMWIPPFKYYKEINVRCDIHSDKSVFRFYQRLIELRRSKQAFSLGKYENITENREGMYMYSRTYGTQKYMVVCNFEKENLLKTNMSGKCVLSNKNRKDFNGIYAPFECAVFEC